GGHLAGGGGPPPRGPPRRSGGSWKILLASLEDSGAGRVGSPPGGTSTQLPALTTPGARPALACPVAAPSSTATKVPMMGVTSRRTRVPRVRNAWGVSTSTLQP